MKGIGMYNLNLNFGAVIYTVIVGSMIESDVVFYCSDMCSAGL